MTSAAVPRFGREVGLTDEFWSAAGQGRLLRPVCGECGRSFFTPRWSCPFCRSEDWSYQPSTGRGRVYSSTVVHRGPDESWTTPYVLAIVDLDEGWSMLSRLVLDEHTDPNCASFSGLDVAVRFVSEKRPPHRMLPVFAPASGSQP